MPYDVRLRRHLVIIAFVILLTSATGCREPAQKSDAQLGLNTQQSRGRRIFERDCVACHTAYGSNSKGPSLAHLFRRQFLPSGLPATDRFVEQTIIGGRNMMPPIGRPLTPDELDDLLAYLHTL